ncbi:hypothetical protein C1631_001170 [Chryseobacterium phosphatilyticum]|uniref:DUF1569 domain-containing protein n=1 Tax=Chryseobacterium phosphatilyticum TaxID=475075 RepID=A0A316XBR0_9FLAO|nr:DUF1569 domain-containing protein [Chryseobacterium phosphatilyticum]PWN71265.1 hypothetical protein C1631_001170 [Chryseobacterium phosphatilyticum]
MRKNLLKNEASTAIIARVKNLSASHTPLWGEMTATEMLLHCNSCNQQILQENENKNKTTTLQQFILRILALYIAPNFKKNIKGESRHDTKGKVDNADFEEQKTDFILLIALFSVTTRPLTLPHPAFGNISTNEWGIAAYKHMDHHLRQFGV